MAFVKINLAVLAPLHQQLKVRSDGKAHKERERGRDAQYARTHALAAGASPPIALKINCLRFD